MRSRKERGHSVKPRCRGRVAVRGGMKRTTLWHSHLIGIATLLAALNLLLALPAIERARAADPQTSQAVAYSEPAIVRLTVQYADRATGSLAPVLCTGQGVIVATTGGNTHTYIVTDAQLVSPTDPCNGAIAAYQRMYATIPASWSLTTITAYLSTAYSGLNSPPVALPLSTSAVTALPATENVAVLPLELEPTYDLPVLPLGDATSVPHDILTLGTTTSAAPYTADTISLNDLATALIPYSAAVPGLPYLATPTPTLPATTSTPVATPSALPTTAAKTATPSITATIAATPTTYAGMALPPGTAIIDDDGSGFGHLMGIVVVTATGSGIAGPTNLAVALSNAGVTSQPGTFANLWHTALASYYAASGTNPQDAHFGVAVQQFTDLQQKYPDFHAVSSWIQAAQQHVAPAAPVVTPTSGTINKILGISIWSPQGLISLAIAVVVLLLGLFFWGRALATNRHRLANQRDPLHTASLDRPDTARMPALAHNGAIERRAKPDEISSSWRMTSLRPTVPLPYNYKLARLGIRVAGLTDPGLRRKADPNQDTILALHGARLQDGEPQPFGIFVVADGMGGHQFGREASIHAIEKIVEHILAPLMDGTVLSEEAVLELLKESVIHANAALYGRNLRQHADMGTTVTAALVTGDIAHLVNVGDSRIYHLQPNFPLRQITLDHSVVAGLVAAGVIKPDDIYTHPKRNQIYRSLGEKEEVEIDAFRIALQPGDMLLLCSDGLWEMVRDPRLEALLRVHPEPQQVAYALIEEANSNGGVDNISAVVVKMLDEQYSPQQTGIQISAGPPSLTGA